MTDKVLTAARFWIGTPYRHQGRVRGVGCDCLGLVLGVWREVYGTLPEAIPAYSPDWAEPQGIEVLLQAATRHLTQKPVLQASPGALIVFRMPSIWACKARWGTLRALSIPIRVTALSKTP